MKIAITGDNHLDFLPSRDLVNSFYKAIAKHNPAVTINLGDTTNGWLNNQYKSVGGILGDLYVLGNHDIWSPHAESRRKPDESLAVTIKKLSHLSLQPLEKSFTDKNTVVTFSEEDCVFVGTMGFPDFSHPIFIMPKEFYNTKGCTNDTTFIDLTLGWLHYTKVLLAAFGQRLHKAVATNCTDVVVATHYPIFEGQYRISSDDISAYFFCHEAGMMVKKIGKAHPNKRFWCFAAHAHDYCRGHPVMETDNILSFGMQADYGKLTFSLFNTDNGFDQDFETLWFDKPPEWAVARFCPLTNHVSVF